MLKLLSLMGDVWLHACAGMLYNRGLVIRLEYKGEEVSSKAFDSAFWALHQGSNYLLKTGDVGL